jgi:hypothetical protein
MCILGIVITNSQIVALAPDANSIAAGKKLGTPKPWKNLGHNAQALWGECQGSALYHVAVDLTTFAVTCSCPSHKFPCKHGLGLLFLADGMPGAIADNTEPPDWVTTWLTKRAATQEKKKESQEKPPTEKSIAAQAKTAAKRQKQVEDGIATFDLWLADLMRAGLTSVEEKSASFWEGQAARLMDAKAPGLAGRVRKLSEIPGASKDWPERLLGQLGLIALLTQAYRRIGHLDPDLQEDVRQLIGWTLKEDEVAGRGTVVTDDWYILGQHIEDEERLRVQRTWLLGAQTGRPAVLLQFSAMGAVFSELIVPGMHQQAELAFWPGVAPVRARFVARKSEPQPIAGHIPGAATIDEYLTTVATSLARQPWQDRFLCALSGVTPAAIDGGKRWQVQDRDGMVLPLKGDDHWQLLALSGGAPVDLAAEWDGETLLPFGVAVAGTYHLLGGGA